MFTMTGGPLILVVTLVDGRVRFPIASIGAVKILMVGVGVVIPSSENTYASAPMGLGTTSSVAVEMNGEFGRDVSPPPTVSTAKPTIFGLLFPLTALRKFGVT